MDSRCKIAFFSTTTKGHPLEAVGGLSDFFFVKKQRTHSSYVFHQMLKFVWNACNHIFVKVAAMLHNGSKWVKNMASF